MSYQVYKMMHIISIVLFFSLFALAVFGGESKKIQKALTGVFVLVILVSGMGLVARIGIPHGAGWPIWLKVKLGIWAFIGILGHIVLKRFPKFSRHFYFTSIGLLVLASYMANYKVS